MEALLRKIICICLLPVIMLTGGCAQSGEDELITITTKTTTESSTTAASEESAAKESDGPDRDEVNLDGDGFQCDWHETVELTEEDELPVEEIPLAFAEDENFWYDIYEDHVAISMYIGTDTVVEVPATFDGLPVTEIYGGMDESDWGRGQGFRGTEVEKVTLPEGLLTIGYMTFMSCANLKEINIPDSVTRIGDQAFGETPWYESLSDEFVIVGDGCLIKYNGDDTSVTIPDGVKRICGAFDGDKDLVSVNIPNSVIEILADSFTSCSSLESIAIPESVVEIDMSFHMCSSLVTVDIPESVILLTDSFSACGSLTEVTGAENVTVLSSFYNCEKLTEYPFTEGIVEIGDGAFYACALTEVDLPQSLKIIGDGAFKDCKSLTTVKNGQNVVMAGTSAFMGSAWFEAKTDYFVTVGKNVLIGYHGEDTEVAVPDTVTYLGGAFSAYQASYSNDALLSVTIPESVRGICDNAFSGHPNIQKVTILGENVLFGSWACASIALESFVVPEGTAVITTCMFSSSNVQEIEIPDSVVIIGNSAFFESAFSESSTIKTVEIPDSVLMIGSYAFAYCKDLTDITIPASVTRIGEDAFEGCSDDLTIHGEAGSRAESYAAEYGINFEVIS